MDRDQTRTLLATRSTLTSQPYSDRTVDHWHGILIGADFNTARLAVIAAATCSPKVTVADVLARIPKPAHDVAPTKCELCDSTGYVETTPHPGRPCLHRNHLGACHCHAVTPCHCTIGQSRKW